MTNFSLITFSRRPNFLPEIWLSLILSYIDLYLHDRFQKNPMTSFRKNSLNWYTNAQTQKRRHVKGWMYRINLRSRWFQTYIPRNSCSVMTSWGKMASVLRVGSERYSYSPTVTSVKSSRNMLWQDEINGLQSMCKKD